MEEQPHRCFSGQSWKIQCLDLTQAAQGILQRDERFGYIALPEGITLKQAIDMGDYGKDSGEEAGRIVIAVQNQFEVSTGQPVNMRDW